MRARNCAEVLGQESVMLTVGIGRSPYRLIKETGTEWEIRCWDRLCKALTIGVRNVGFICGGELLKVFE